MSEDSRTAPASFGQRRLWFFDRLEPRSSLYNMHHAMFLPGVVEKATIQSVLSEILRRHEVLRTTFRNVDGQPIQVIHPPVTVPLQTIDLSDLPEEKRGREWQRLMDAELGQAFDLGTGPLYNFILIQLEPQQFALSVCIHHIVFDDWSVEIFDREFHACLEDVKAARPFSLPETQLQYGAFSTAQRLRFERENLDEMLGYWRSQLRDLPPPLDLPIDKPRPSSQTFPGAIRTFALAPEIARDFRALTRASNATMFMSLFAAFAVLLRRHCGQGDLVLGTPIANRNRPELANLVGFMVNTLVLRVNVDDDPTFKELLVRAREMAVEAFAHQDVPFELLVEDLKPERQSNRQPIFQTMFVFQSGLGGKHTDGGKDIPSSGAKFDLVLTAIDAAPHVCGEFEYNTDLFTQPTMARMAAQFETLIASIVADPDKKISELDLLSPADRKELLEDWNATAADVPPVCVHDLVDGFAASQPKALAVVQGETRMTYADLARRSDALAGRLRGLPPETRIGMCLDRSVDWIVAMLGIAKAGCAMVPLDPALPADRIAYMVSDAGIETVLTTAARASKLAGQPVTPMLIDDLQTDPSNAGASGANASDPASLAYVIYTSGSTGRPKGVLVEHGGLTNLALAQGRAWAVGPDSRVLQFASLGFDAAMSEVFSTLCLGATLRLAPTSDDLLPGAPLLETLRTGCITHVTLPPSALAAMQPQSLPDLKVVISAGEHCEASLAKRWAQGRRLVNAYGPTEITVCATMHDYVEGAPDVPIGRPIANMQVYVLDSRHLPVPPGVTGEIVVGGAGVARGYLNRPDLTSERFIADHLSGRAAARLYKTGDLGRFDASGTLHYLGRADGQLKIRGYRIEPGEIESVLRQHAQVADALVVGHGKGPDARLVAYVLPKEPPPLVIELRGFLARQLPEYMAPAAYVMVEAWPKTSNGKIDRAALPRPDSLARDLDTAYVAPTNDLEQQIAAIWRDVLEVDQVGSNDNFFDLGGHSLLLIRVHDQLREKLKADLTLVDLFRLPTVKRQAEVLEAKSQSRAEAETLGRTDQRAARQAAARMQRRTRTGADRHA